MPNVRFFHRMSGLERSRVIRFRYVKNFLNGEFRPIADLRRMKLTAEYVVVPAHSIRFQVA